MRRIGFSTGALALSDFDLAIRMLRGKAVEAIELSALRKYELTPLVQALDRIDVSGYSYVSVHAPSRFEPSEEQGIVDQLKQLVPYRWPIVLHPDAIHSFDRWVEFGDLLCIENMDKRKGTGRTLEELEMIFERLPDARFCFDIAHAKQVDSSMMEAYRILKTFGTRIRQVHISEVNTSSKHGRISAGAIRAFKEVSFLIPAEAPAILETPVAESEIEEELMRAVDSLSIADSQPISLAG
jgi:hypothetical protein